MLSALSRGFCDGIGQSSSGFLLCEFPLRLNQPSLPVLAMITREIHQKRAVHMTYHSPNREPSVHEVVPPFIIDSGVRWHTRVFDRETPMNFETLPSIESRILCFWRKGKLKRTKLRTKISSGLVPGSWGERCTAHHPRRPLESQIKLPRFSASRDFNSGQIRKGACVFRLTVAPCTTPKRIGP